MGDARRPQPSDGSLGRPWPASQARVGYRTECSKKPMASALMAWRGVVGGAPLDSRDESRDEVSWVSSRASLYNAGGPLSRDEEGLWMCQRQRQRRAGPGHCSAGWGWSRVGAGWGPVPAGSLKCANKLSTRDRAHSAFCIALHRSASGGRFVARVFFCSRTLPPSTWSALDGTAVPALLQRCSSVPPALLQHASHVSSLCDASPRPVCNGPIEPLCPAHSATVCPIALLLSSLTPPLASPPLLFPPLLFPPLLFPPLL